MRLEELEWAAAEQRSAERRSKQERDRQVRLRRRIVLLPLFGIGLWLLGSNVFKSEGLPSPALIALSFVLIVPFCLTFYSDQED